MVFDLFRNVAGGLLMSVFGDFVKLGREVPRPQRIRELAEVLRVDVSDLMRYAGYLPDGEPPGAKADEPFHRAGWAT